MKLKDKIKSLRGYLTLYFIILLVLIGLFVLITALFGILYAQLEQLVFMILLWSLDGVLFVGIVAYLFFGIRRINKIYNEGAIATSLQNYELLKKGNARLEKYPEIGIEEFDNLNKSVELIGERWGNANVYSPDGLYYGMNIPFIDGSRKLIPLSYLENSLDAIIDNAGAYECGFLELFYELRGKKLNQDQKNNLLHYASVHLSFIPGRLFAFSKSEDSLICFLPAYDSLSIIEEKVLRICEDCAISAHSPTGLSLKPLKGAFVSYPDSGKEDIFHDLSYARRQGNSFNLFLPHREKNNIDKLSIHSHEEDKSFFQNLMTPLYRLSGADKEKEKEVIQGVFSSLCKYLGSDKNDVIYWERNTDRNYSYFDDPLTAKTFPVDLINKARLVVDKKNSYYFSSRESLNNLLARRMDELGVKSGYIFCFDDGNEFLGLMYILKTSGSLCLDAYRRESLSRIGRVLTDYFSLAQKEERALASLAETEHILALSQYGIYKLRDSDYHLTYISPNLRTIFPEAKLGEPCHKALYGHNKPCSHCPIKSFAKMEGEVSGRSLVTSLTLNDRKSHERSLLIEIGRSDYDLYDKNWLTYSYYTLIEQMRNIYANSGRGYLLLLCLDNIDSLLEKQGSEGALFAIRSFIGKIKSTYQTHDVYSYNPATIGVLLPRFGHAEIIDVCEKIYNLSQETFFDDGSGTDNFHITYLPLGYPHGFSSAEEFLSHVEEHYRNPKHKHNIDYIYFYNHSISCAANRTIYMTDIIDKTFGEEDVNCVTLQPMLTADRHIYGAEILLRVMDDYRQRPIQAWELSKIAVQTGKIPVITYALVHFVEALYKEYGNSVFAVNAFTRIAINTDSTFLEDTAMIDYVKNLYTSHELPQNFLSFEISEDLIHDDFESKSKDFLASGVALVCDRYSGRDVSLEKLKKFGFSKVKITRDLIKDIDSSPNHREEVLQIIAQGKELGLVIGAVGVENEEQYNILKNADPTIEMQGFYFYKPLSRSDLISAIRSYS